MTIFAEYEGNNIDLVQKNQTMEMQTISKAPISTVGLDMSSLEGNAL